MALNREQRRAMLASELTGEEVDVKHVDAVDPAPVIVPTAGAPAIAPDMATLIQMLAAAIQSGNANIGTQMADAIRSNRQPIPENAPDQFPAQSIYHPAGKAEPIEPLKTEMFLGVWDNGKATPTFPFEEAMLTDAERTALNSLKPGTGMVSLTDGSKVPARVVAVEDAMGTVQRMVIALPKVTYEKDHRNTIPGPVELARQLAVA